MNFLRNMEAGQGGVGPTSSDQIVARAQALVAARAQLDPATHPPDPAVIDMLAPEFCLDHHVLPWGKLGTATLVATSGDKTSTQLRERLEAEIGPVVLAQASAHDIQRLVLERHSDHLARLAESQVPADLSCRDINHMTPLRAVLASIFFGLCLAAIYLFPAYFFACVTVVAIINLLVCQAFKIAAFLWGRKRPGGKPIHVPLDEKPVVSVIVPLYREADIANSLVKRLSRLTYPKALLDIVLVLEKSDTQTKDSIAPHTLPAWMRVIEVPDGHIKTKPRALNYALRFCRGDIIGILDAEDAPATDQIERVVDHFHGARPDLACVQGILDFYNRNANWLARCFAIEYATWFRVILPGAARMGFAIPLGGTTLYLRRSAIDHVGGWDAHNVTEDADLGVRLARFGYRTELLNTVTREEANNRVIPWIKQRSRWLKGYMITYIVHMRRPWRLFRDMGAWKFLGFQLFFLTAILQFTLAPALWSFWLILFGLSTPFLDIFAPSWTGGLLALFLATEAISLLIGFVAVARSQHDSLMVWVPMMLLYFPLGVFAAYKAVSELIFKPFYWDKTQHGVSAPDTAGADIHVTRR